MEKCKICESEGKTNTAFKKPIGLSIHLRRKHGISLEEYKDMYTEEEPEEEADEIEEEIDEGGEEEMEEVEVEKVQIIKEPETIPEPEDVANEPVIEKVEVETKKEINEPETVKPESNGLPKITNYSLMNSNNFVAIFRFESSGNETYKKIIGVGNVIENEKNTLSALVIGDDGLIIPVFMIPEFIGIVEIKNKIFAKDVKSGWAKQKKTAKRQVKRVSSRPGLFTRKQKSLPKNVTNEELVEGFSKILARQKR